MLPSIVSSVSHFHIPQHHPTERSTHSTWHPKMMLVTTWRNIRTSCSGSLVSLEEKEFDTLLEFNHFSWLRRPPAGGHRFPPGSSFRICPTPSPPLGEKTRAHSRARAIRSAESPAPEVQQLRLGGRCQQEVGTQSAEAPRAEVEAQQFLRCGPGPGQTDHFVDPNQTSLWA